MEEQTLNQILDDLKENTSNPELIKNNKFYFEYKDCWFFVRMPNQKELAEANKYRNRQRILMLQKGKEEGYILKKDLIELLKKNGIDIKLIEDEIQKIKKEIIQLALTAAKKKDTEKKTLEKLEEQTKKLEIQLRNLSNERAEHLAPAIEYQAEDSWYKYLTAQCTEKCLKEDKEKSTKLWKSLEDYEKDDSTLPYYAEGYFSNLIQNG